MFFIWLIMKVLFNFEYQHVDTHTLTHPQELNKRMTYPPRNNLRNGMKMTLFYLDILDLIRFALREIYLYGGHGDIP